MSVGLPGTGVGAAFYLLSALWAPLRSLLGRGDARSRGFGIALVALGIIAALSIATIALSMLLPAARTQVVTIDTGEASSMPSTLLLLLALSPFGTLALLLAVVRLSGAIVARRAAQVGIARAALDGAALDLTSLDVVTMRALSNDPLTLDELDDRLEVAP